MKFIFILSSVLFLSSCDTKNAHEPPTSQSVPDYAGDDENVIQNQTFNIDPASILKDYSTWYNYFYHNVLLSQDFIGLNVDSAAINKPTFLNRLMRGNTVPFKIKLFQGRPVYQLYPLDNKKVSNTIIQLAEIEMNHYKMEGKAMPPFDVCDLNGIKYDENSTKGKILVLKCWFIRCTACIKEFPKCNKLVDRYSGRNDIAFISLAIDKKKDLIKFLETNRFKYSIIPEAEPYMTDKLSINTYPTHLLVDKTGTIVKVVNAIDELEPFLVKEAGR